MTEEVDVLEGAEEETETSEETTEETETTTEESENKTYAGKYKTVEDLEQGAIHQEDHIKTIEAENRLLRDQVNREEDRPDESIKNEDSALETLLEDADDGTKDVLKSLVSEVRNLKGRLAERDENDEVSSLRNDLTVDELKDLLPDAKKIQKKKGLSTSDAFRTAASKLIPKLRGQLTELTKQNEALKKKAAFVDGGGGNVPEVLPDEDKDLLDDIFDPTQVL
jgi:hypothetical protein